MSHPPSPGSGDRRAAPPAPDEILRAAPGDYAQRCNLAAIAAQGTGRAVARRLRECARWGRGPAGARPPWVAYTAGVGIMFLIVASLAVIERAPEPAPDPDPADQGYAAGYQQGLLDGLALCNQSGCGCNLTCINYNNLTCPVCSLTFPAINLTCPACPSCPDCNLTCPHLPDIYINVTCPFCNWTAPEYNFTCPDCVCNNTCYVNLTCPDCPDCNVNVTCPDCNCTAEDCYDEYLEGFLDAWEIANSTIWDLAYLAGLTAGSANWSLAWLEGYLQGLADANETLWDSAFYQGWFAGWLDCNSTIWDLAYQAGYDAGFADGFLAGFELGLNATTCPDCPDCNVTCGDCDCDCGDVNCTCVCNCTGDDNGTCECNATVPVAGNKSLPPAATDLNDLSCTSVAEWESLVTAYDAKNASFTVSGTNGYATWTWPLIYFAHNSSSIANITLRLVFTVVGSTTYSVAYRTGFTGSYTSVASQSLTSGSYVIETVLVGAGGYFATMADAVAANFVCPLTSQVQIRTMWTTNGLGIVLDQVVLRCYVLEPTDLYDQFYSLSGFPVGILVLATLGAAVCALCAARRIAKAPLF